MEIPYVRCAIYSSDYLISKGGAHPSFEGPGSSGNHSDLRLSFLVYPQNGVVLPSRAAKKVYLQKSTHLPRSSNCHEQDEVFHRAEPFSRSLRQGAGGGGNTSPW